MKNSFRYIYVGLVLVLLSMLIACQETLVSASQHPDEPYSTLVDIQVDWSDTVGTRPDSLYIVGWRIVNDWWCAYEMNTSTGNGVYKYNAPSASWAADSLVTTSQSQMKLRQGDYRFYIYTPGSIDNQSRTTGGLIAKSNVLSSEQILAKLHITDFTDFNNTGTRYLEPYNVGYMDSVEMVNISEERQTLTVQPHPMCQHLNLSFPILKDCSKVQFVVDSVFAELSGIPVEMSMTNMRFSSDNLSRTIFPCKLVDANGDKKVDSQDNDTLYATATLDLLGLVPPANDKLITGSGVMQVLVYYSIYNKYGFKTSTNKVQAILNLYNVIQNANITRIGDDGEYYRNAKEGDLKISSYLKISGSGLQHSSTSTDDDIEWEDGKTIQFEL